ncbi:MAG TPA: hypothetical protein VJN62_04190 [Gemmatimonadales bacterium]|nr:hypothetical protein [Gemmatimonadales bacterium]
MANRLRVGDMLEIQTPRGLAYAQYTHRNPQYGALIRVLPRFHRDRPADFLSLAAQESAFVVFYPVSAALTQRVVTLVANAPVPPPARDFPLFRAGVKDFITKRVEAWWLWDGKKSWPVGLLTREQRKLPVRMLVNHTGLVHLIATEWTPERDTW